MDFLRHVCTIATIARRSFQIFGDVPSSLLSQEASASPLHLQSTMRQGFRSHLRSQTALQSGISLDAACE